MTGMAPGRQVHVVHLMYRFAAGGLENVIVQLINGLPRERFRHTVLALTTVDDAFAQRIEVQGVELIALDKPPGQPFGLYPKVFRLLRRLRPDVLHSCNIAALEFAPVAALAGVPLRVHAEHGWDVADPDGSNHRYRQLRRFYQRFVHQFVAVSDQLRDYLLHAVGIAAARVHHIPNGVDTARFRVSRPGDKIPADFPFEKGLHCIVGTVGRLEPIKNQPLLARAFVELVQCSSVPLADRLRLAIVGAGPLEAEVRRILVDAGMQDRLWLPGARSDVPEVLRALDLFVLPSLSEGTSCTLQEAMATGLPIVATDVGGNQQLLGDDRCGLLVPSQDITGMARAMGAQLAKVQQGLWVNCVSEVCARYGMQSVLAQYMTLFEGKSHG